MEITEEKVFDNIFNKKKRKIYKLDKYSKKSKLEPLENKESQFLNLLGFKNLFKIKNIELSSLLSLIKIKNIKKIYNDQLFFEEIKNIITFDINEKINDYKFFPFLFSNDYNNLNNNKKDIKIIEYPTLKNEDIFLKNCPVLFFNIQIQAIRWMKNIELNKGELKKIGGVLGDEMGLGKTYVGLGLIYYDFFFNPETIPTLIIVTLSLIYHWKNEAINNFGFKEEEIFIYHEFDRNKRFSHYIENNKIDDNNILKLNKIKIIITTYDIIQNDFKKKNNSLLYKLKWNRVLFDEAHITRNKKTKTFKSLQEIQTNFQWAITGTPFINFVSDIRSLSYICTPHFILNNKNKHLSELWKQKYFLRRTKDILNLPKLTKIDVWLEFDIEELNIYTKIKKEGEEKYNKIKKNKKNYQELLTILLRLRQCSIHYILHYGQFFTTMLLKLYLKKFPEKNSLLLNNEKLIKLNNKKSILINIEESINSNKINQNKDNYLLFENNINEIFINEKKYSPENNSNKKKINNTKNQFKILQNFDILKWVNLFINCKSINNNNKNEIEINSFEKNDSINYFPLRLNNKDQIETNFLLKNFITEKYDKKVLETINKFQNLFNIKVCTKLKFLLQTVEKILSNSSSSKIVIFTNFITLIDLIELLFLEHSLKILRFDGTEKKLQNKEKILDTFKKDDSFKIILVSLKAGGVGLNFLPADYLFLLDPWWNRSIENQSNDRIHRIGQTKPVTIIRILMKNSIEQEIIKIQYNKTINENKFYAPLFK